MTKIKFEIDDKILEAELNDSRTVKEILKNLPLESILNRWGDEIYFSINLTLPPENPTTDIEIGDIAYWPQGNSICIFFGPTPISNSDKPVPADNVNLIGKVISGIEHLKKIPEGSKINLTSF